MKSTSYISISYLYLYLIFLSGSWEITNIAGGFKILLLNFCFEWREMVSQAKFTVNIATVETNWHFFQFDVRN